MYNLSFLNDMTLDAFIHLEEKEEAKKREEDRRRQGRGDRSNGSRDGSDGDDSSSANSSGPGSSPSGGNSRRSGGHSSSGTVLSISQLPAGRASLPPVDSLSALWNRIYDAMFFGPSSSNAMIERSIVRTGKATRLSRIRIGEETNEEYASTHQTLFLADIFQ